MLSNAELLASSRPGIYSAWNWKTGQYDYYSDTLPRRGYGDQVKHPKARLVTNLVGETPEESAHPLPRGTRKVGSGESAMGEVVDPNSVNGGLRMWGAVALIVLIPTAVLWFTTHMKRTSEE